MPLAAKLAASAASGFCDMSLRRHLQKQRCHHPQARCHPPGPPLLNVLDEGSQVNVEECGALHGADFESCCVYYILHESCMLRPHAETGVADRLIFFSWKPGPVRSFYRKGEANSKHLLYISVQSLMTYRSQNSYRYKT